MTKETHPLICCVFRNGTLDEGRKMATYAYLPRRSVPGRAAAPVAAAAFSGVRMRTHVYVDGYNLYYGSLKRTPHKWLNIHDLCTALMPRNDIRAIRYFTAQVSGTPRDPDQPTRQQPISARCARCRMSASTLGIS